MVNWLFPSNGLLRSPKPRPARASGSSASTNDTTETNSTGVVTSIYSRGLFVYIIPVICLPFPCAPQRATNFSRRARFRSRSCPQRREPVCDQERLRRIHDEYNHTYCAASTHTVDREQLAWDNSGEVQANRCSPTENRVYPLDCLSSLFACNPPRRCSEIYGIDTSSRYVRRVACSALIIPSAERAVASLDVRRLVRLRDSFGLLLA